MRYFAGKTLGGDVRAANALNFRELVDRYLSVPIPIHISRAEFDQLPPKEQDKVKTVPYLTAGAFKQSPSRRKKTEVVHCNLIFLDIDPPKVKGQVAPASILLRNIDVLPDQLSPWSFAVYHTARSTEEVPRLRVVVDADSLDVDDYESAVRTVAKRLGLPKVTTESMVPSQAMFRPVVFQGQDTEEHQPLVESRLDGKRFTAADIDPDVSGVETERKGREHVTSAGNTLDALDFLRRPVDELEAEDVQEMLDSLDPDMEYREWLDVAAALKHQFQGSEEGYQLFDTWSSAGSKYAGQDETAAKWDSFVVNPIGKLPVTIRSVMHRAALVGWQAHNVKERQFEALAKWFDSVSSSVLLSEGPARIAASPMLSQVEEEALLNMLSVAAKKHKLTVSVSALRKDMRASRERLKAKPDQKQSTPPWVRGVVYVACTEEFYRHSNTERFTTKSWDQVYAKKLLPTEKMLEDAGLPVNQSNLAKPFLAPAAFALNVVRIPTVWDYTYDPSTADTLVIKDGKAYVNTYRKCSPRAVAEDAEEAGALFQMHIAKLIREEPYQRTLTDWLAFHVQHPGVKIRWAPLIQGAEGCGKTFLSDAMAAVLGRPHVKPIGGRDIFSGWTEWATGHQLVVLEEVRVTGVNRHEVMNILKPLITNDVVPVAEKFRNSRHVDNHTNYLLLTNHKDSLVLDNTSRRYFVLQSTIQQKQQVQHLRTEGHFAALYEMLQTKPGGLRSWFEDYEISASFDPDAAAPETRYLTDLIHDSANEVTAAVRRIIAEGDSPLVQADVLSSKVMLDLLHDREGLRRVSAQHLSAILREEGYDACGRHLIGEYRHYIWQHANAARSTDPVETARRREHLQLANLQLDDLL